MSNKRTIVVNTIKIKEISKNIVLSLIFSVLILSCYYFPRNKTPISASYPSIYGTTYSISISSSMFPDEYSITNYGISSKDYKKVLYIWSKDQRSLLEKEELIDNIRLLNNRIIDSIETEKSLNIDYVQDTSKMSILFQRMLDSISSEPKSDWETERIQKENAERNARKYFENNKLQNVDNLFQSKKHDINFIVDSDGIIDIKEEKSSNVEVFFIIILPLIVTFKYLILFIVSLICLAIIYGYKYFKNNFSVKIK